MVAAGMDNSDEIIVVTKIDRIDASNIDVAIVPKRCSFDLALPSGEQQEVFALLKIVDGQTCDDLFSITEPHEIDDSAALPGA